MDKEIKDNHFIEYKTALKNLQEKRAFVILDVIEEIFTEFNNKCTGQGGKMPLFESWSILYDMRTTDFLNIRVVESEKYNDRTHININVNLRSGWFTLYCPVYCDTVTDGSPFKKSIIEMHHRYFPELKSDYDEDI